VERTTLLYDEDCGLCRWAADRIVAWDRRRRLAFAPIQGPTGRAMLAGVPEAERLRSAHAVTPDGTVRSGGAAAGPVLRELPFGLPLSTMAEAFPRTTERVYRFAAERRVWFGARVGADACSVDPAARR
jgi:predicted DCC family thiol-disulfide oxidoreductase YuxK